MKYPVSIDDAGSPPWDSPRRNTISVERFIAIDNVCAWPNLTLMPDGTIIATIFNQPCHGLWEGDIECWVSLDGGSLWERRGVPAPHEPKTNRMYAAAGLAHDSTLIVIASGCTNKPPRGEKVPDAPNMFLDHWVCRSTDGGKSWQREGKVVLPDSVSALIPFGDIVRFSDGTLGTSLYSPEEVAYFFRSRDGGRTWAEPVIISANNYNETNLLYLDDRRLLAAVRKKNEHVDLFVSEDCGLTWNCQGPVTMPRQHPAHLSLLADGRILLVYGIRNRGLWGVGARVSGDGGKSWGAPIVLVDLEDATDGGYPSSVQLKDGMIVVAYYCNHIKAHRRYHMGILRWRADA